MKGIKCEVCGMSTCKKGCENSEKMDYYQLVIECLPMFTNLQLASIGFETWEEARQRSGSGIDV